MATGAIQRSRRLIRTILWTLFALGIVAGVGLYWVSSAIEEVPEFYRQAKEKTQSQTRRQAQQTGAGLQERIEALSNASAHSQDVERYLQELEGNSTSGASSKEYRWQEEFSEVELNVWLATELQRLWPGLLPPGVSEPQVRLANGSLQLGFYYEQGALRGVVSMIGDLKMTDQKNEVAIRIREVNMGSLPLPVSRVFDLINQTEDRAMETVRRKTSTSSTKKIVRWSESEGDPVVLIQMPDISLRRGMHVQDLVISDGRVKVIGKTVIGH